MEEYGLAHSLKKGTKDVGIGACGMPINDPVLETFL